MDKKKVTIIVPFYKGNIFMDRLFESINKVASHCNQTAIFEVIIVNDSPEEEVIISQIDFYVFDIKVIKNQQNFGIHKTRINGLKYATGEWIIFLDQDDEIIEDGFEQQLLLADKADIVVGNAQYEYTRGMEIFYKSKKEMCYLINKRQFLDIHDMIPSPGECLIKKNTIPQAWIDNPLSHNGADDYLLWLLFFCEEKKFVCNEKCVYIHHNINGTNLSLDLRKMYESSIEMCELLESYSFISDNERIRLRRAIEFKYLQDTKNLSLINAIQFSDVIFKNVVYKIKKTIYGGLK
jgi:glycosyltransferase involved in cell wall biosynthesis